MAEVDGNRTRQTRFARLNCFEGSGTHQAYGHLPCPPGGENEHGSGTPPMWHLRDVVLELRSRWCRAGCQTQTLLRREKQLRPRADAVNVMSRGRSIVSAAVIGASLAAAGCTSANGATFGFMVNDGSTFTLAPGGEISIGAVNVSHASIVPAPANGHGGR